MPTTHSFAPNAGKGGAWLLRRVPNALTVLVAAEVCAVQGDWPVPSPCMTMSMPVPTDGETSAIIPHVLVRVVENVGSSPVLVSR